jgi:AraC-like DNA-binding protein
MDVNKPVVIKVFEGVGLSYFDLAQSMSCISMTSTPLSGDASIDAELVDLGPLLIVKRTNSRSTIEELKFGRYTLACQLPMADASSIEQYLNLPGGKRYNPFQPAGTESQWLIPENTPLYHLQVDAPWLKSVLGAQALRDYKELYKVESRKSYDPEVLHKAALAVQHAMEVAKASVESDSPISASHLERLASDILLPCIMSDLADSKASTRQNILSKALDYIREHYAEPISLTDLSASVSTSDRNLQIVFKQELGITPSRYLHQFRLHRFRLHLVNANSVSEAAHDSGFKHLGRLTEQYAKVFDSYPSEDLLVESEFKLEVGSGFE